MSSQPQYMSDDQVKREVLRFLSKARKKRTAADLARAINNSNRKSVRDVQQVQKVLRQLVNEGKLEKLPPK